MELAVPAHYFKEHKLMERYAVLITVINVRDCWRMEGVNNVINMREHKTMVSVVDLINVKVLRSYQKMASAISAQSFRELKDQMVKYVDQTNAVQSKF